MNGFTSRSRASNFPSMDALRAALPGSMRLAAAYACLLLFMGVLVSVDRQVAALWAILMIPVLAAALLHARRLEIALLGMYLAASVIVIILASPEPYLSLVDTLLFALVVLLAAEMLYRFAGTREQGERALRESEERFRSLSSMAPVGIIQTDSHGDAIYTNPRWQQITGQTPEHSAGKGWIEAIHLNDRAAVLVQWLHATKENIEFSREFRMTAQSDEVCWVHLLSAPMQIGRGGPQGRVAIVEDINSRVQAAGKLSEANDILESRVLERTSELLSVVGQLELEIGERKRVEAQLQRYADLQASLLSQATTAQERERRRLSMDIHDGPLQQLGVALMALDRARRRVERAELGEASTELYRLRATLHETIAEVRAVLADLSVDALTHNGIGPALEAHAARFSEITGIDVKIQSNVQERLPAEIELLMYRLAQEALANIRKHAGAKHASVSLHLEDHTLTMVIVDDGKGFNVEQVYGHERAGEKLGLRSMAQRMSAVEGVMEVDSTPGQGTTLTFQCIIPDAIQGKGQVENAYLPAEE